MTEKQLIVLVMAALVFAWGCIFSARIVSAQAKRGSIWKITWDDLRGPLNAP